MIDNQSQAHLEAYLTDQSLAENMIPTVGRLYRECGLIITVFGRKLMNASAIEIIKAHKFGRYMVGADASLSDTNAILNAMTQMKLGAARIDIGKLAHSYAGRSGQDIHQFISEQLGSIANLGPNLIDHSQDVVLYGFGRIGRILARLLIERATSSNKLRLRAIVARKRGDQSSDLQKRASLLRRDSIHGPFNGTVTVDEENCAIIANGNYIKVIYADKPEDINYQVYDIDDALIVDNTGKFKDKEALSRHLIPKGASKVLITAPAKGDIENIVYGVNEDMIGDSKIVSAASCTTNAITPVLKVIDDEYGIISGHVETVHSYTNDQNLIDNYHSADRRGRSAPLNMVLTSTGAATAVAKAIPGLKGKLTGNAIRVPTPNVSMAVMNLNLSKSPSKDEINNHVRSMAYGCAHSEQIAYSTSTEVVSSDLIGVPEPAIFDSVATIAQENHCVLYVWYDNEYGYSTQVVRVMRHMVGIHIPCLPA